MGPIIIAGLTAASVTDLLNDTRLQTVPANGVLTVEFQAADADATNQFTVSVQLPNGDTPMNGILVPKGATAGSLNSDDKMMASFTIRQGGHATISLTETGSSTCWYRISYTPIR